MKMILCAIAITATAFAATASLAETALQRFVNSWPVIKGALLFPNLPQDILHQFERHNPCLQQD